MSKASTAFIVIGVLVTLAGIAFLVLDALGKGDSSGIDPKDIGLVVVGIVLGAVGAVLGRPQRPTAAT